MATKKDKQQATQNLHNSTNDGNEIDPTLNTKTEDETLAQQQETVQNNLHDHESEETKLLAENAELKDKFRRLFAEFDNFKKRTAKERIELFKTAGQDIIKELLPVLDDFERAIKANEETKGPAQENDGFVLIHKKLAHNLERKGLKKMPALGEVFDVELHEALVEVPGSEAQKGKIMDVLEEGYFLNDKIIRHAKVVVAK